jgi:hypothetical protein
MQRASATVLLLISLLFSAATFAACGDGGDGDDGEPTATQAEPTGSAGEATPTEEDGGPTEEPVAAIPFDSFHYTVDLDFQVNDPEGGTEQPPIGGTVEGDFVAPDSHRVQTRFEFVGVSVVEEVVIIGEDAWYREGEAGDWTATSLSDERVQSAISLSSADPDFLPGPDFAEDIAALESEPEERNGVQTRRYHIPAEALRTLGDLLGEDFFGNLEGVQEFEMTVWLEEETGGLVRAELSAVTTADALGEDAPFALGEGFTASITLVIDLTEINSRSISIEPPV